MSDIALLVSERAVVDRLSLALRALPTSLELGMDVETQTLSVYKRDDSGDTLACVARLTTLATIAGER